MPQPDDQLSVLDRVSITNFFGMDASRNPAANEGYGVGLLAINIGRNQRQPLHARLGLRPTKSENDNHVFSGTLYAMGALAGGNRLSIIVRLSGGRLVAATGVELL